MTDRQEPRAWLRIAARGEFAHLWAKTVTGTNLEYHCHRSLAGRFAPNLGPKIERNTWIDLVMPGPGDGQHVLGWYVCGVARGNQWARNFHLFAVPAPGQIAYAENDWVKAGLSDARAIPIDHAWIDPADKHSSDPRYATCRNWQTAWMIAQGAPQGAPVPQYDLQAPPDRLV